MLSSSTSARHPLLGFNHSLYIVTSYISPSTACLYLCTLHPDLQTTKLVIDMPSVANLKSSTINFGRDLISLFGMTSLQKISISGCWGHLDEVKHAIVQGLRSGSIRP